MFEFAEDAMEIAAAYRLACRKYRTIPIDKIIKQVSPPLPPPPSPTLPSQPPSSSTSRSWSSPTFSYR
jgi:hypothetical protein